ncbi:RusA-like resolvase [Gordonia phage Ruthy]|uniref:RusA-like resolvase n=2 Tax=Ruthyvirus TaxID=2733207 RepID=A0A345L5I1_9CAUD|nr:RusA-like Holliday junction resolvase [Gordonia phage Ruthy]YP_010001134.1 RusA-like Holliday junction resolvase [Gordonia phage DumpsterDude]AXH50533.1 RusA-like resolvase [Gordonia phage Ruthy]QIN93656.1 RusA-like resolvase [Gordonia phage DumpsterDude]
MTHTITIPTRRPIMLANDQRRWHWTRVRQAKADMQHEVWAYAKKARIPKLTTPIRVQFTWHIPDQRPRDADGLGPFAKAALDALVQAGLIPDDSWTHVLNVATAINYDPTNPRIDITIEEIA